MKQHPLYLCISFDTDLLAMEPVLGYVRQWIAFAREHEGLTIEVRTKAANYQQIADIPPLERVILAWSLSPQEIVHRYEHKTASLPARLDNAAQAVQDGWKIRLCFDPVIIQNGWGTSYRKLVQQTFQKIPAQGVLDVGIGTFRVAKDALKRMRKGRMESALLHYPYTLDGGVYQYDRQVRQKVLGNMRTWLQEYLPEKSFMNGKRRRNMQTAIVTGASSGIGRAVSHMLVKKGFYVYGFGRTFPQDEVSGFNGYVPVCGDITELGWLQEQVRRIRREKTVSLLVNNAGVGYFGLHEELNAKKIHEMVTVMWKYHWY